MTAEHISINWKAVVAAMVANWLISVVWYAIFGSTWAELTATPPEWNFEVGKVIIGLAFNLLLALGVAVVIRAARPAGAAGGALWGLLLTVLFILPAHSGKWTWQDKPLLLAIDSGAHLLALVASGAIIGAWNPTRRAVPLQPFGGLDLSK